MQLEEGVEKLLDGSAVMFAGTGCSVGAINLRDKPLLKGDEFAKYLAEKAGMAGINPLEIAAEAFVEKYGDSTLIREIQNEFTVKVIADHHVKLGDMPWKHLYTTNYDNVLEEAYKQNSKNLIPITASDNPFTIPKNQTTCIHLNGFVQKLDLNKINTERGKCLIPSKYITISRDTRTKRCKRIRLIYTLVAISSIHPPSINRTRCQIVI